MDTRETKALADDFYTDSPPQYASTPGYAQQQQGAYAGAYGTHQTGVIITQPAGIAHQQQQVVPRPNAVGAILGSCCVFLFCCWPLGLAAFIFAVMSTSALLYEDAVRKIKTANLLSLIGLICGGIMYVIVIVFYFTAYQQQPH